MSSDEGGWSLGKKAAAAWFIILILGLAIGVVIFALRVPIAGPVEASTVFNTVVFPAVLAIGGTTFAVSWVAARHLWGKDDVDGVFSRVFNVARESGAAEELREQNREQREELRELRNQQPDDQGE